jgi:hypothetical protein
MLFQQLAGLMKPIEEVFNPVAQAAFPAHKRFYH